MRKVVVGLLGAAMVTSVGVTFPGAATAAPPADPSRIGAGHRVTMEDLPNPLEQKRRELREEAVNDLLKGTLKTERRGKSLVAKVGRTNGAFGSQRVAAAGVDQYVELSRERTDKIFVVLAEFGNQRHPDYPDRDTDPNTPGPTTFNGPLHNRIPQPDRRVDNSTVWQADYNREHYRKLYFGEGAGVESLKTYYEAQSSGRYSVEGEVSDWVKVQYNEARYGRNCNDPNACDTENAWALVRDAANQWYANQKAAGRTDAQLKAELQSFDRYDRYDFDHDGNFDEPDGYLDHFQIVHAGGDESDGDRQQGEDAIWAHRWYAWQSENVAGPAGNLLGGTQIGTSGIWIGDYTMQPENGGLSVFAHEYAHDLGLPDDYDTSENHTEDNNEYWTLMAQSRLSGPGEANGTRPGDLGAWNKLQLGWLDVAKVTAGTSKTIELGPQEYNTTKPQAAVVVLPNKVVTRQHGTPYAGQKQFFSGNTQKLNSTLTRTVDLSGATSASLRLKGRYDIEQNYDFLYVEASTDAGRTWTALDGTVGGAPFARDGSKTTPAITGASANWTDVVVPLNAYAGKKPQVRLHYKTDAAVAKGGFLADNLTVVVNGVAGTPDGAEDTGAWTPAGFKVVGATSQESFDNFYIAGHRSYVSYDKYLKTGPYHYGYPSRPAYAERFALQPGLLISYNDASQEDNNVNEHPGAGRNLIIDSRPAVMYNVDGAPWPSRIQNYDAPFGLTQADSFTLHVGGRPSPIRGRAAQPLFDDTRSYFDANTPQTGVKLPAVGVKIQVLSQNGTTMKIKIS
ncbi:immune inhibitor A domain-containing protein [Krasilnikovia cinnamomea]|uniref:immune inhibitor A domain-containing protein n=1 Tax=Krasilnikovia cinnamomea TaxID=349313 RepID=UPI00102B14F4|nr:immune inhibitor A domain-containing protein [Krasilnikovia cinnamomea]